ncbi:MAG TPA: DUF3488 domain-containing protein, partial [Thermoleophilia bacterium]|nr:DUF3488 domain-containing protein [Thermoleophilia bacterium]
MTLPQLFKFLSFLMVLLGTLSLLVFGHHASSPGTGLLVIVALFGGLFMWESRLHTAAWESAWKVVAVLFVGYVVLDILGGSIETAQTRVVKHAANLSIFLHLFKIYNRKTARDYKQMYLISFFQFVSCTTLTTSFGFFFLFALYVVVALWTLSLFHIRNQVERHKAYRTFPPALRLSGSELFAKAVGSLSTVGVKRILSPAYFAATFALAVLILLISLGMFFLFPRQEVAGQSGLLGRFQIRGSVTGLSGEVDLDRYGRISEDPKVVMEVSLPYVRSVPHKVLWRAGALAYYDGTVWQESPPGGLDPEGGDLEKIAKPRSLSYRPEYAEGRYGGLDTDGLRSRSELWEMRVTLQPGDTKYLVSGIAPPVRIESHAAFIEGPMGRFTFDGPPSVPVSYTVFAGFAPPPQRLLEKAGYVGPHQDPYGRIRRFYRAGRPLTTKAAAVLRDEIK